MKKIVLLLLAFAFTQLNAQNFRLTYYLNGCPGNPLIGSSGIYLYAGAGTVGPTSTYDYTAGTFAGDSLALTYMGSNTWEICFNPYQIFYNSSGTLIPNGTTLYNFEVNFRDSAGIIFTGQCGSGNYIKIDNPMTSPQTLFPNIVHGLPVATCVVGVSEINGDQTAISCFPNPMNGGGTTFKINLPEEEIVTLRIFNMLGNKVRTLLYQRQYFGLVEVNFNGHDDNGSALPGGCYFYSLQLGDKLVRSGKLMLLH